MIKQHTLKAAVWLLSVGLVGTVVPLATASDEGWIAAEQVSVFNYRWHLKEELNTRRGDTRRVGVLERPDHRTARLYIKGELEDYGLSVDYERFTYQGIVGWNIVATKPGTLYPDTEYVIGAHYDSYSEPLLQPAPGADDNASGVALVLEAARVISQYPSDRTIRFIAFDYEEHKGGAVGSMKYVYSHGSDDIWGMISADMVAYNPGHLDHALIFGRKESHAIKNALAAAIDDYSDGLTCTVEGRDDASDHFWFEETGRPACLLAEGIMCPRWHTPDDCFEEMLDPDDFEYGAKMTRAVVGFLVDAARVRVPVNTLRFSYPNGLPRFNDPRGCTRLCVEVTGVGTVVPESGTGLLHYRIGNKWFPPKSMDEVSPNVYEVTLPGTGCGTNIYYYVSAEAVGGGVYEDPRSGAERLYVVTTGYGRRIIYRDSFDTNPVWACDPPWEWGVPLGLGGEHGQPDPTAGCTGAHVLGYDLHGDYANSLSEKHCTSPPINCEDRRNVHLHFCRWLGVEAPGFDHASVRASADGSTWIPVWENDREITDGVWHPVDLDISAVADDQPVVYLRWTMGTTDDDWRYCGWNIDDVVVTAINCVLGDMNCDGQLGFGDINPFILALTNPVAYEQRYPYCNALNSDINCDGVLDFGDINPFVGLLQPGSGSVVE